MSYYEKGRKEYEAIYSAAVKHRVKQVYDAPLPKSDNVYQREGNPMDIVLHLAEEGHVEDMIGYFRNSSFSVFNQATQYLLLARAAEKAKEMAQKPPTYNSQDGEVYAVLHKGFVGLADEEVKKIELVGKDEVAVVAKNPEGQIAADFFNNQLLRPKYSYQKTGDIFFVVSTLIEKGYCEELKGYIKTLPQQLFTLPMQCYALQLAAEKASQQWENPFAGNPAIATEYANLAHSFQVLGSEYI